MFLVLFYRVMVGVRDSQREVVFGLLVKNWVEFMGHDGRMHDTRLVVCAW